jgi:hypothetical protein
MSDTVTESSRRAGFSWSLPTLIVLGVANAALMLSLLGATPDFATRADAAAQVGRPSEYALIPVSLTSTNQDVLAILDTQNGGFTAAAYDRNQGIQFIRVLPLGQQFDAAAGRR